MGLLKLLRTLRAYVADEEPPLVLSSESITWVDDFVAGIRETVWDEAEKYPTGRTASGIPCVTVADVEAAARRLKLEAYIVE